MIIINLIYTNHNKILTLIRERSGKNAYFNLFVLQSLLPNIFFCLSFSYCTFIMTYCRRTLCTTKKTHFLSILFWNFFHRKYLTILLWKKFCKKLLPIFLQNILYKTFFATNFVRNTCEFYNFVGNNYPRRNYLQIKILRKNDRKKYFFANSFNKFTKKNPM